MAKPRIYISHPIRGKAGKNFTKKIIEENCKKAVELTKQLAKDFRFVDWYCPAEHDEIIQILYQAGKLSEEDILWADCEIIKRCDGLLVYAFEGIEHISSGMRKEMEAAAELQLPTIGIVKYPYDKPLVQDLAKQAKDRKALDLILSLINKEIENEQTN